MRLRDLTNGLTTAHLDMPYRDGGWTIRQVIHHLPDSHMNSYVRFKLALTEDTPTVKTYDEAAWAMLNDSVETPVETSLALLESLHARWVVLMRGLTDEQWQRNMRHPERLKVNNGLMRLDRLLALYAWHSDHHIAHVKLALTK